MKYIQEKVTKITDQEIYKIKFENDNNYSVEFYNFGGCINSIRIPYHSNPSESEDVLLGYNDFEGYVNDTSYLNCIVGRVSGRISNAKFILNNNKYKLYANDGNHHLHGGKQGFNKKIWKIVNLEKTTEFLKCVLEYISPHLEEGYPGQLDCKVTYLLTNKNEFKIDFVAESNHDTTVSLTNHNYWNFHGHRSNYQNIENHIVKINGQFYCESDMDQVPSGKLLNVKNSKLNFLDYKNIDSHILQNDGIDTCYCVSDNVFLDLVQLNEWNLKKVATVYSQLTNMGLCMYSNQPGLQFYTGNMMEKYYEGKYERGYGYQHGLCLEPQSLPDSINCKNFIKPILKKGKKYHSVIIMKLKNNF
jgi:aldose 1-epimerase